MKNLFASLGVIIILAGCSSSKKPDSSVADQVDTTKLASGTEFYQCPMHPDVISITAGTCPDCKMDLKKVVKQ
jgi:hypothetical protein